MCIFRCTVHGPAALGPCAGSKKAAPLAEIMCIYIYIYTHIHT